MASSHAIGCRFAGTGTSGSATTAALSVQVRALLMVPPMSEVMELGATFLPLAAIYAAKNRCACRVHANRPRVVHQARLTISLLDSALAPQRVHDAVLRRELSGAP